MRIREGNDFTHNWAIERGGIAENIQSAISRKLFLKRHREAREITDYDIIGGGNIIHTEFTPDMLFGLGDYTLELHYVLSDSTLSDEDRRCAVDVDAFTIVARTAMADNVTEMAQTSDIALALRGKSAYDLWIDGGGAGTIEDYFAYLRQPAADAAESISELEQEISENEGERVTAEGLRENAELARANAEGDATKGRVKAENERVAAEGERAQAFAQMMGEADDKIEEMDTTLSAYNGRVTQVESDLVQLAGDVSVNMTNLVANGDFANGTTGWVFGSNVTATKVGDYIRVQSTGGFSYFAQTVAMLAGVKYYVKGQARRVISQSISINIYSYPTSTPSWSGREKVFTKSPVSENELVSFATVYTPTANKISIGFSSFPSPSTVNEWHFYPLTIINLGDIFGEGNEPTKEEMDLLISTLGIDYFEGEITIPAQKVMQWQLKMIRQNRSAIIALGGTII